LTLRAASDTGAHFMPAARATLEQGRETHEASAGRRNRTWDLQALDVEVGRWVDVFADLDELRVAVIDLEASQTLPSICVRGAGASLSVVQGRIESATRTIIAGGFLPLDAGAESPEVVAGVGGSRLGLFQLPVTLPIAQASTAPPSTR